MCQVRREGFHPGKQTGDNSSHPWHYEDKKVTEANELLDDLLFAGIVRDIWQDEFERRFKELVVRLANK